MKVLIAEDDPVSRRLLESFLQKWDYEVVAASDGEEAWRFFQQEPFPLVVSDWMMPQVDGLELVRRIRGSRRPGYVFTILLTAKAQKEDLIQGMTAGADDFIVKPFDREELRARLRAGERIVHLEEALVDQNRVLSERNAQMEADLHLAAEIQQALLPQRYPAFPPARSLADSALRFCHRYRPTGTVGGDFFDVRALSDTQAAVLLCDVMGHGVRAALVTAMVRTLIEQIQGSAPDPGWFLTELNHQLFGILGPAGVVTFLSAFYLVADAASGEVCFANAGHPTPLHLRQGPARVIPLESGPGKLGPPLGVRPDAVYHAGRAYLAVNDRVVLFTDGLYEVDGPEDTLYSETRLYEAVRERIHLPTAELFDQLLAEVQRFAAGKEFSDDVCLVGIERAAVID
jgi:sigma-B regulation protein RsbU (phosphoserine phosphatase)